MKQPLDNGGEFVDVPLIDEGVLEVLAWSQ
jgi:hypothetical protein